MSAPNLSLRFAISEMSMTSAAVVRYLMRRNGNFLSPRFENILKGVFAVVVIARLFYGPLPFENVSPFDDFTLVQIIAGVSSVIGHIWTIFAGFKGGKGIATALGMLLMLVTVEMLIAIGVFILVVTISKYVSLGSLIGAISIPISLILRENVFHEHINGYATILPFVVFIALLVVYTHRKNVVRILNGTENKLSFKKKFNL